MASFITAVILAAGKGTRMKSDKAKVLHDVFFKPMVHHVLDSVQELSVSQTAVIIGHQKEKVIQSLGNYTYTPVIQEEQLGTGHAVICAEKACIDADYVLILCGDTPLLRSETLNSLIQHHLTSQAEVSLLTTTLTNPYGYGRILKDATDNVVGIVEEKDASEEQQEIKEINAGVYMVSKDFLFSALKQVGTDNSQQEVYLTDIIAIASRQNLPIQSYNHPVPIDVLGVNSRVELAQAHQELQLRCNQTLMLSGITMLDPETILIEPTVQFAGDCLIHGGVQITGKTTIANSTTLSTGAVIHDCIIEDGAFIGPHAVLENCIVGRDERIPPLIHRVS